MIFELIAIVPATVIMNSDSIRYEAHKAWEAYIKSAISYIPLPNGTGHPDEDVTLFVGVRSVVDNLARQHPGFPLPKFPKTDIPHSFVIRPTPTMGLGMFSKRAFNAGDVIVRERPLMVCLNSIHILRPHPSRNYVCVRSLLGDILMRGRMIHMSSTNRDAFMELSKDYHFPDMPSAL
ncbi:hypothetical protein BDZ89DRAFT_1067074 [Hymenopellis radicata]|nr:hypothetical protein BDZ89DRAFT_1067074 [Hymenopellis radicata]